VLVTACAIKHDEDHLRTMTEQELRQEAIQRRDHLMAALMCQKGVAEASERLKRARLVAKDVDKQKVGGSSVETGTAVEATPFSSGGFL
jgi:hypothetical protein